MEPLWAWAAFIALVLLLLGLDLGVFHRKAHVVSLREAATWSLVWVGLAALFGAGVYVSMGTEPALQFASAYLIEKALSVDNLFVFVLLFAHFSVPAMLQHRVLFWGILGAMVMRGVMIAAGVALLTAFHWIIYVFGAFLFWAGARMLLGKERSVDPHRHAAFLLLRRFLPVANEFRGQRFLVREPVDGVVRWVATPLLVVLLLVETTDLIFAVDSIPAVLSITRDPFIVFTSNVLAILGLRTLYFLLANVVPKFRYLKTGISVLLVFVGAKMLASDLWHMPVYVSLGMIALVLTVSTAASLVHARRAQAAANENGTRARRVA